MKIVNWVGHSQQWLRVAAVIAGLLATGIAYSLDAGIPLNAYANQYGSGWSCEYGYERLDGGCSKVVLPTNAYLDSLGIQWECHRGYVKKNGFCEQIVLPANAYLVASGYGTGWECERSYRSDKNETNGSATRCIRIVVPEHGFLTSAGYGSGWACEPGYQTRGESCVKAVVPQNAHLNYSSNDWSCNEPYRRNVNQCERE